MRRELRGSVVVVSGATSGIGLSAAESFSRLGCRLVLVGRDADRLADAVTRCERLGATVEPVLAELGPAEAALRIRNAAVRRFGRIDTWINVAGVVAIGPVGSVPAAELDRLVDTNVRAVMHASETALGCFVEQGDGVLINVSSLLGVVTSPLVPAYVMSKFALVGLSRSLRQQVGRRRIRVCLVLPGSIDTPLFEKAANHTGRRVRAIVPAASAVRAGATLVGVARRPRRQVVVGWSGRLLLVAHRISVRATDWALGRWSMVVLTTGEEAPGTSGGIHRWSGPAEISGGWRRGRARRRLGDLVGTVRVTVMRDGHGEVVPRAGTPKASIAGEAWAGAR